MLIAAIFLFSSYQKLSVPLENFEEILRNYAVFPEDWILLLSHSVPYVELVLGIFVFLGFFTRTSLFMTALVFSGFTYVTGRATWLKLPIQDCGCFGGAIHIPPHLMVWFDAAILALALFLIFSKPTFFRLDSLIFERPEEEA
jgi:uncharacterized membrane protein YphA (DoxX/SURF4 family)